MEGSQIDVDGLCMNCGEQGHNKLMMTRIPNFREIIIVAFECKSVSVLRRRSSLRIQEQRSPEWSDHSGARCSLSVDRHRQDRCILRRSVTTRT